MSAHAFETIQELELNAWPDLLGAFRNGWRLRLSGGFTGRANSVTALRRNADLTPDVLAGIEAIYAAHRLPMSIRMTELVAPGLDDRLASQGYQVLNPSEFRATTLTPTHAIDAATDIAAHASADWIADFGRLNGRADFRHDTMTEIVGRIVLPAGFAVLREDGVVLAIGMAVIDRGLMEVQAIAVDASSRRRGLGRRLVASLLAWGRSRGADDAILSVAATNTPAIRLYSSLGFEKVGGYHYRVKAT